MKKALDDNEAKLKSWNKALNLQPKSVLHRSISSFSHENPSFFLRNRDADSIFNNGTRDLNNNTYAHFNHLGDDP